MKKYVLSFAVLVAVVPAAISMDNRYQEPRETDPAYIFTVLNKSAKLDVTYLDAFLQRSRPNLNLSKKVSDRYGKRLTPPLAAIEFRITPEKMRSLIAYGADVNATVYQKDGVSGLYKPLSLLSWFVLSYLERDEQFDDLVGARQLIRFLLAQGADANKCYGECSYDLAHKSCRTLTQGALIAHILRTQRDQFSHLIDAIDRGSLDEIATICSSNLELLNRRDEFGFTPLGHAFLRSWLQREKRKDGTREVVVALLSLGARGQDPLFIDPENDSQYYKDVLELAADNDWNDVIEVLRGQGVRLQHATNNQELLRRWIPEDFECAVCLNPVCLNKAAKLFYRLKSLSCGHIFCEKCANGLREKVCPICRAPIR